MLHLVRQDGLTFFLPPRRLCLCVCLFAGLKTQKLINQYLEIHYLLWRVGVYDLRKNPFNCGADADVNFFIDLFLSKQNWTKRTEQISTKLGGGGGRVKDAPVKFVGITLLNIARVLRVLEHSERNLFILVLKNPACLEDKSMNECNLMQVDLN